MSLLLRKACEETLNLAGLGNYHVRIDGNNNLSVVGECGKIFFTVSGIKFSRSTPTGAEVKYAAELLSDFCVQHKNTLQTAVSTKLALFKAKPYEATPKFSVNVNKAEVEYNYTKSIALEYNIKTKELSIHTSYSTTELVTAGLIDKLTNTAFRKEMVAEFKAAEKFSIIEDKHNDAISLLNKCDI